MTIITDQGQSSDSANGGTAIVETPATIPDYLSSPNAVFSDEGVEWRYGKPPDYSKTRKVWEEGKKMNHAAGSLPQLVENLVKNWEVEASFKPRLQDWRTIDHDKYTFAMNGGCPQSAEHMLKVGTYNAIIAPNEYYDPSNSDFASSHKTFKRMMPTFAWEVMEVYSGPPKVAFQWRHWGEMKNDYVGFNDKGEKVTAKAHGGPIEIFGVTVADVDDKVRVQALHTWMDPLAMFRQIAPHGIVSKEIMNRQVDRADALDVDSDIDGLITNQEHDQRIAAGEIKPYDALLINGEALSVGGSPIIGYRSIEDSHSTNVDESNPHCFDATSNGLKQTANGVSEIPSLLNEDLAPHDCGSLTTVPDSPGEKVNGISHANALSPPPAQMDIEMATLNVGAVMPGTATKHLSSTSDVQPLSEKPSEVNPDGESTVRQEANIDEALYLPKVAYSNNKSMKQLNDAEIEFSAEIPVEGLTDQPDATEKTAKSKDSDFGVVVPHHDQIQ